MECVRFLTSFFYRREFKKNASVDKKDFSAVEFMLRMGHRKLEMYAAPGIIDIH